MKKRSIGEKKSKKVRISGKSYCCPWNTQGAFKKMCHEDTFGQLSILKTKAKLLSYFYWPKCYKHIKNYVKLCDVCQRLGKPFDEKKKAPWVTEPIIPEVFNKIKVDACRSLPTSSERNKYTITTLSLS